MQKYLKTTVLSGLGGAALGAGFALLLPYISMFASTSFTFGGLTLGAGGTLYAGVAISGSQILETLGVIAGIGLLFAIPKHGTPNSTIRSGNSYGEYDANGNLSFRVDTAGKPHFIKKLGKYFLPHKHIFRWALINGVWRFIEEVIPYE